MDESAGLKFGVGWGCRRGLSVGVCAWTIRVLGHGVIFSTRTTDLEWWVTPEVYSSR